MTCFELQPREEATCKRRASCLLLAAVVFLSSTAAAQQLLPAPQDNLALGNRTPLILIHGWQFSDMSGQANLMEGNAQAWDTFLHRFVVGGSSYDANLAAGVKPFLFVYPTDASIEVDDNYLFSLGGALKLAIEAYDSGADPWAGRPFVILAHSMGGLVARNFMQRHWWDDGSGQCGGRVTRLVTLATPHHGTPLADNDNFYPMVKGLVWDGFDGAFSAAAQLALSNTRCLNAYEGKGAADWCADPAERQRRAYFDRIVAYGGGAGTASLSTIQSVTWGLLVTDGYSENDFFVPAASGLFCNAAQENSDANFCDQSVVSALTWQLAARRRTSSNCTHLGIHEETPCTVNGVPVLQQVVADICAALPGGQCTSVSASLTASPSSGPVPLQATLQATLSGTAQGPVNFTFWRNCTDPGVSVAEVMQNPACGFIPTPPSGTCIENSKGKKCNGIGASAETAVFTYSLPGIYTAKVIVEQGAAPPAESRRSITVNTCPGPAAPTLQSPVDNAQSVSSTPLLAWTSVPGASPYDVRVCSDALCATPVRVFSTIDSQWGVTPSLASSTTFHWQVRANNGCGAGPWSSIASFGVAAPSGGGGDFSVVCSPATLSAPPGGGDGTTCTVTSIEGFSGAVSLAAQGLPAGISASSTNWNLQVPAAGSVATAVGINVLAAEAPGSYPFQIAATAGATVRLASLTMLVGGGPDFSFSCSPALVTVLLGSSAGTTCSVTSRNGFAGSVSFSQDGAPARVGIEFSPASVSLPANGAVATTTVTFVVDPDAQVGTWNAGLVATAAGLTHETLVTLGINSGPDFSLSCNPATISTIAGSAGATGCVLTAQGGFSGQVVLGCQTSSPSVSCAFTPASVNLTGAAQGVVLSAVTASFTEPIGYNLVLSAASGAVQRSGSAFLVVQSAPDFSVSCDPSTIGVSPGGSAAATCTVQSLNGFTGSVTPTCSGLPAGASCSFVPAAAVPPANGSAMFTATLMVSGTVAPGNYATTIHATSGVLAHDANLKLNVLGSGALWERTYPNGDNDAVNALAATSDGGMVLAGSEGASSGFTTEWGYLLKLDAHGNFVWKRTYSSPLGLLEIWGVARSGDGFIVAGRAYNEDPSCGDIDMWLAKLDSGGSIVWQENLAACGRSSAAWSVIATTDGGYLAVGDSPLTGAGGTDAWVIKVDALGAIQWQRAYGTPTFDRALGVRQTADGGYVVVGNTATNGEPPVWVMKLDAGGALQWQHGYGGSGLGSVAVAYDVEQMTDGGYVFAAWSEGSSVQAGRWIVKVDSLGGLIWQKRLRSATGGTDSAGKEKRALLRLPDDSVVVAGDGSAGNGNGAQIWLTAVDSGGSLLWQRLYQQQSGVAAAAYGLARASSGDLLVAGESYLFNSPGQIKSPVALSLSATGSITSCPSLQDGTGIVDDGTAVQTAQDFMVTDTTVVPAATTVSVSAAAAPLVTEACSSADAGFVFACAPTSLLAVAGQPAASTCTVSSLGGFSAPTGLTCANLPPGLSCAWSSPVVTPPAGSSIASNLIVTASPGVAAGVYSFEVDATSGASTQKLAMSLRVPAPVIGSVLPPIGPSTGGTEVIIKGQNFGVGATVAMGSVPAVAVVVLDPTTIQLTAPAHAAGTVDVVVTNANGQAAIASGAFTFVCAPAPMATVSGDVTVCPGGSALIQVTFAGTPPYSVQWWDGLTQSGIRASAVTRTVNPVATTTYGVRLFSDAACAGTAGGSATVTVDTSASCGSFYTVQPCRVVDTRGAIGDYGGPALSVGEDRQFVLAGLCGVPPTAKALSLNVTVVGPTTAGNLILHPGGSTVPLVSTINYSPGAVRANNAVARLAAGASLAVYAVGASGGTVNIVIDVNGYFQ
jgi:pimeloyl-ACP methyl ester carboxylesterase